MRQADASLLASEKDATVVVFDAETGPTSISWWGPTSMRRQTGGKHVFLRISRGIDHHRDHLLGVDESAGHIQLFDLKRSDTYNRDLAVTLRR
jgi:hypothetical protein